MPLPKITYKEFLKNPIVGLLFLCLMSIGYLYYDHTTNLKEQVDTLEQEVKILKDDYKELNDKLIETLKGLRDEEN